MTRLSLLVVLLVVAGLMWSQSGSYRNLSPQVSPDDEYLELPSAGRSLPPPRSARDARDRQETARSPTRLPEQVEAIAAPPSAKSIDWMATLYPELARIAELENHAADTALLELVPLLASEDPAIRLAAIDSIGDMTTSAARAPLIAALDDPHPQVRVAALQGLALRGEVANVAGAIESSLFDRERTVRIAAIEALAILESSGSVYALAGLLSDRDAEIRHYAVGALGEIGGEQAESYLRHARYDPSEKIRANAAYFLDETRLEQVD